MNKVDKQYLELLREVRNSGVRRKNRTGVDTIAVLGRMMRFDLSEGFPLLTTKKVHWKSILHELLWFLRGDTNIQYLQDNGVTIWNEWADKKGELGPVYGAQWRHFCGVEWIKKKVFDYEDPHINTTFKKINPHYSVNESGMIGKIFPSNYHGEFQVIKEYRLNEANQEHITFDIQFQNTNYILEKVKKDKIISGCVKDKYNSSVCGIACIGEIDNKLSYHKLLYPIWIDMIRRCYDSNNMSYKNYGQRGVFVDTRWLNYANFLKDAISLKNWYLKKEFPTKYSLDKDICGSNKYSRETCVWASRKEQDYNRRNRLFRAIDPEGSEHLWFGVKFFAERYGFSDTEIIRCLSGEISKHMGWKFVEVNIDDDFIPRLRIVDQIDTVISEIKNNPNSRRIIVSAWNPIEISLCKLPPCHNLYQFFVVDNKLSCIFNMRSCDVFLGLPFNIASYALLTHMIAHVCGLEVGELIWIGNDVHIYINHVRQIETQLSRDGHKLPELILDKNIKNIDDFRYCHIDLRNYRYDPSIKAEVAI